MIQVLLITQSDCIGCEIMTDIILSIKKTYDDNKNININICNKDFIDRNILKENNIKYLLDLHVMANFRHQDICIGTGLGKNIHNKVKLLKDMEDKFIENGFLEFKKLSSNSS